MKKPTHTPGPWKYGKELSARTGEWLISFDAGNKRRGIPIAETRPGSGHEQADASLIAAAPTMLETLDRISDLSCALRSGGPAPEDLLELSDALEEAVFIASAAVALATGEFVA